MAKVVKFKDKFDAYLDDENIKHNGDTLKDRLNHLQIYAINKFTGQNNYVDFNIKDVVINNRCAYLYLGMTNAVILFSGVIGIHNGNVLRHSLIAGNASVNLINNHTIRISGLEPYSNVSLIGSNPIIN